MVAEGAIRYRILMDEWPFCQGNNDCFPTVVVGYFPYRLAAAPIEGPALARSCGFMIGRNETLALNARNHGSATAGISDVSFISNTMEPDRWPSSSAKK